ncbi:3-oxoacyl-ACP reductase FabG [Moorella sp. Hama-1]|uniref:3-oxoacyl-ACP reductase FabG n=1 Tax=Moorella sp. Hama-1 TaxID=2138101 RepID=UPI000D65EE06|nr:3-oxoacyl-ACP reductase FabG [Moorella sp. Hama-1]BCV21397.1 beta-ketoacyl-ACP reductase [Moorella sp. Hama-1]
MKKLAGKITIVTGGGRGIGKGIAVKLATEGSKVLVADVAIENANAVVAEIKTQNREAAAYQCNIANRSEVEEMFKFVEDNLGPLYCLVNNAGINRDAMLHKMTMEQWDQVIAVNLTGTFYCTQLAAQLMRERERGRIINIASASWLGNIGQANYAASKAGVVGLTKTAAKELAKKGITVNAICPGFIDTEMTRGVPEKVWDIMISKIPMGRVGKPEDVANLVAFLASEEAGYITGEVINVGGGFIL